MRNQLMAGIFKDELGAHFDSFAKYRPSAVKKVLTNAQHWCDVEGTEAIEACRDVLTRALDRALSKIAGATGTC